MKTYSLVETKHKQLFRVVDLKGDWEHYFHQPTKKYLRSVTSILGLGYPKGAGFEAWLSKHSKQEQEDILKAAGERGDRVHRAIDMMLHRIGSFTFERGTPVFNKATGQEETLADDEWNCLLSFGRFWAAHKPVVHVSDAPVFSVEDGYAGTLDALITLREECGVKTCRCAELIGKIGLWDWKTSKGIWPSYSAQAAAYAYSDNIGDYLPEYKTVEYVGILRIGTSHKTTGGYELKSYSHEEMAGAMARFFSAKTLAEFENEPFSDEWIGEIPDSIKLTVEHYNPRPAGKPKAKRKSKKKKV